MKPLASTVAFRTPFFEILAKTLDPAEPPWYSLRLPDYAAVLALTPDERVLIVRQYRPAVERYVFELPSGLVDPGESPEQAARRELLEETACQAETLEVLDPMLPDTGRLGNRIWNCFATGVRPVESRVPEAGIEVVRWTLEELTRALLDGRFDHSLHVSVLLAAMVRGKLKLPAL
jgi:ADP-ribose pyrophosphatase